MGNLTESLSVIAVQSVSKSYNQGGERLTVLRDISCNFLIENSYALTGVSGSGKSTLLHIIGGLDRPTSGTVLYDGHDSAKISLQKKLFFRKHVLGYMFQFHYLIKELSVFENCLLPAAVAEKDQDEAFARVHELLDYVGLRMKKNASIGTLSGGQMQRLALARSLCNRPAFLLADEPTGSLDAANAASVIDLLIDCQRTWRMGMIICTHDPAVYNRVDTVYHLEEGRLA